MFDRRTFDRRQGFSIQILGQLLELVGFCGLGLDDAAVRPEHYPNFSPSIYKQKMGITKHAYDDAVVQY